MGKPRDGGMSMATNPTNIGLWKGRGHREEAAWKLMSFAECPPTPHAQDLLGMQTAFFSTTTIRFQDFSPSLGPAEEQGSDHFSWLSSPAICNFGGKGPLALQ